jgi:twinkle protein
MIQDIELAVMNCYQDTRILCPACSDTRKKSKEKTLSIKIDGPHKIYHCFHCDASGKFSEKKISSSDADLLEDFLSTTSSSSNVIEMPQVTSDRELREFMASRSISEETYKRYGVVTDTRWFNKTEGEQLAVGFVYGDREAPSAVKWRSIKGKAFTQTGAAKTFYGLENLPEDMSETPLVICEGEIDALSFASIGIPAVSVPNGAPAKFVRNDDGVKFGYLWESRKLLETCSKIILATDHDGPGDILKQEIGRRVGLGKCWEVQFSAELKDSNAVLCAEGPGRLKEIIEAATPMPLAGVYRASDYSDEVHELYEAGGTGKGLSTGFDSLDDLITIAPGLYVVTGSPGHGKSAWIDAVMVNTARLHGMRWAICSMENPVKIHILKLAALHTGKPFFEGPTERMSKDELQDAIRMDQQSFLVSGESRW